MEGLRRLNETLVGHILIHRKTPVECTTNSDTCTRNIDR